MATNEVILQRYQAGIEAVKGTPVAATRKVPAQIAMSYERGRASFTDRSGTRKARRRHAYGRQRVAGSATDQLSFEDAPFWYELGIRGGVAATSDAHATNPAYTRLYVPDEAGTSLKSMTLEHGEPSNVYKSNQVMVNSFTVRGDADSDDEPAWMFESELLARGWEASAYTAALTDRNTELILARGTRIFLDEPGGTIGTTPLAGKLISWSVSENNNIHFKAFSEDESDYAANKLGFGEVTVDAQLTLEFDSDAEFAKYRAARGIERLVRLERTGSIIHAAQATPALPETRKRARIDLYGYWDAISWGDREGNLTATMALAAYYNPVAGREAAFDVVNAEATIV